MDKKLPERKNMRLGEFDYSSNGYYFITICTADKQKILCDIVGACITRPKIELSKLGKIVQISINNISKKYNGLFVDKYVIMPNHIHLIVAIKSGRAMHAPTVSNVIGQMKSFVTKQVGFPIWQKSFYDHIIKDENDYLRIWEYIDTNPEKWSEDKYFVED